MSAFADNFKVEKNWYAAIVRPRSEKLVIKLLEQKGLESYVPLIGRIRRYASRIRKTQIPLLPGYVFVNIQNNLVIRVIETDHVYKIIAFEGKPAVISPQEIEFLRIITGEGYQAEKAEENLELGDNVILMSGQLTGMKGRLVEKEGKERVRIELETIGVALIMSVPLNILKKL